MRRIRLTNFALFTLVDDDKYEELIKYKWRLGKGGYVVRSAWVDGKTVVYYMHKHLLEVPKGFDVEHADQNRLNHQMSNLRPATRSQNMANVRRSKKSTAASKFKGVSRYYRKNMKKPWVAYIKKDYKGIHLGYFATEKEAAKAYNAKAIELYGEFAYLNEID